MDEKQEIRRQMKAQLLEHVELDREEKADVILNRVTILDDWKGATCIGITISREFEVSTRKLIQQAWREGKKVAVPRCVPAARKLEFYLLSSFDQLEIVYAGLFEPKVEEVELVLPVDIDLLILPGMAFTADGDRLGYGGGYYDRFLPNYKGELLALAFDFQVIPFVPVEDHDVSVDLIVTEERVIRNNS